METKNKIKKTGLGAKTSRRISNAIVYIVLVLITVVWLFPFFGLVMESFKVNTPAMDGELFPEKFGLDNYIRLFKETDFLLWFKNTALMGLATAFFQTFFVLSMAYTLSRLRFKLRKPLMNFMLILGMFPGFLTMILIYKVFSDLGLTMEMAPVGLIIVYCASSAMTYYVSKGFFDTIPKSLDEAACIDGATRNDIFFKIILPNSMPIVTYTAIEAFIAPWVDFIFVSVIMKDNYQNYTVALGLYKMLERENIYNYFTQFCAGAVLVALPITLLFIKIQKFYVGGVVGGAVKG